MRHDFSLALRKRLSHNVADADLRIILPVALRALVLLFALELEHQNLVAAVLRGNRRVDAHRPGAFAQQQIAGILEQRHYFAERHLRSHFSRQFGYPDYVARSDAKLLSPGFDNCMHLENEPRLEAHAHTSAPERVAKTLILIQRPWQRQPRPQFPVYIRKAVRSKPSRSAH